MSQDNVKRTNPRGSRKPKHPSKQHARKGQGSEKSPFTPQFAARVARLDAVFKQLTAKDAVQPPSTLARGPMLFRQNEKGTLEQVGHEADQAWAGVKRIMQLLNVEVKHAFSASGQSVNQSGAVLDLSSIISQGVGGAQRTGDSLKMQRIRSKFRAFSTGGFNTMQIVLGRSKDGVPSAADVFQVVGSSVSGLSFQNDDQDQANKFLSSRTVVLNGTTSEGWKFFELEAKIDADTLYIAGTTTATSGAVWCAVISDAATVLPSLEYSFDLEFVDN